MLHSLAPRLREWDNAELAVVRGEPTAQGPPSSYPPVSRVAMQGILHQGLALMAGGLHDDFIVETILAAARGTGADLDEGSILDAFLEAYVQVQLYGCLSATL